MMRCLNSIKKLRLAAKVGHFGTGDLEITIGSDEDLEKAKPLFDASYQAS